MGALTSLTGGGGLSASSGVGDTSAKSGDVGGSTFAFEGINTGKKSNGDAGLALPLVIGAAVILGIVFLVRRR
jgi:hypothetical protein